MGTISVAINDIEGKVKITIEDGEKKTLELKWCLFDDKGSTGFLASFIQRPVLVTEVAAEQFLRMVVRVLLQTFQIQPGDLSIINYLGETLPDVEFLPPTFQGDETDLAILVHQQDSLLKICSIYEETATLDSGLIQLANDEDVLDDFLSLVQIQASNILVEVNKS